MVTYQSGTPTTIIGPPISGARVLKEFRRDALGGEWVCTVAGTPGTWKQFRPAAVTADQASRTIPTGYLILNVTSGYTKRHEGGYVWTATEALNRALKAVDFVGLGQRVGAFVTLVIRSWQEGRLPQGSGLGTDAALNGEAHPLAVLEELLTNRRFGAGLDSGLIDYDSWDAAATQLAAEGFSVSVVLDQGTALDALLNDFLEYLDACLVHTSEGKLSFRLLRESGEALALGAAGLTEQPDLTAHGWPETVNEVVVRFANRNRGWQTDAVAFRDLAGYTVTRRPLTRQVECDWITDQAVAWRVAAGIARTSGLPWLEGTLRVRRGAADHLRPGDAVALTYSP